MSRYLFVLTIFIFILGSFTTSSQAQLGDEGFPNTVFAILPESPGSNCPNGGSLIASGRDNNGNGSLGFNEVQQIGYACNGDDGLPGPAGPQGAQGIAGNDGAQGPQGPAGPAGPAGPTGAAGPQGVAGNDGATGPQGEVGPAGAKGDTGDIGSQGTQGEVGPEGPAGPAGPQGEQGIAGTDGEDGAQGPRGDDVLIRFSTSLPNLSQCNNGPGSLFNIFIDMNDNDVFDLGVDEGLEEYAVCDGVAGNDGADGAIGPVGPAGPAGAIGPMGPQGVAGNDGADGSTGPVGPAGPAGAQGPAGDDGAAGAQGSPGINCWDLNANGVNDPGEDINGDGVFNVEDCSASILSQFIRIERVEREGDTFPLGLGGEALRTVSCPPATTPISGGCHIESGQWEIHLQASEFDADDNGWRCEVRNGDNGGVNGATATIRVSATCCGTQTSNGVLLGCGVREIP